MKYLLLVLFFILYSFSIAQNTELIRAAYDNEKLTIIDSIVNANCASKFMVESLVQQNDTIKVVFADTSVSKVYCMCFFTLSDTLVEPIAGNITIEVYHHEYKKYYYPKDTLILAGAIQISIPAIPGHSFPKNMFYQSNCYDEVQDVYEENIAESEQVYPNPATDESTIEFTLLQPAAATLNIYDIFGNKVNSCEILNLSKGINKIKIDNTLLVPGAYTCIILTGNGERKTVRFIINP